jgi:NAD+ kinase
MLTKKKIAFDVLPVGSLTSGANRKLASADLVIAIGGDGTVLGSSHYMRQSALLGVNSAPGDSVGHFCSLNRKTFAEGFDAILSDSWRFVELARLQVILDNRPLPELAINDVLIAHDCPAATTRYLIEAGGRQEEQRSSGVWISTAAGSTAGIRSAGGRVMPLRSRRLQFFVRELYREPNRSYQLTRGMIEPGEDITIASKMSDGELYLDGSRTKYQCVFGMRAQFTVADADLKIFLLKKKEGRSSARKV